MSKKLKSTQGLKFSRQFTKDDVSPFDMFEYDYRTSVIKNPTGEVAGEYGANATIISQQQMMHRYFTMN